MSIYKNIIHFILNKVTITAQILSEHRCYNPFPNHPFIRQKFHFPLQKKFFPRANPNRALESDREQPENKESSRLPFPEPGGFKKQKRTDFSSSSLKAPDASAETTETLLKEKIIVLLKKTNNEAVSQIFTL